MNPTIELLKKHRSIRKFTAQPIPPALLNELFLAAQSAATSSFLQGTTIVRVKSPETRALIAESAGNQGYVKRAAEFLVMCADLKRAGNYCIKNGLKPLILNVNFLGSGAPTRTRTADLLITNQLLYQLSYRGTKMVIK